MTVIGLELAKIGTEFRFWNFQNQEFSHFHNFLSLALIFIMFILYYIHKSFPVKCFVKKKCKRQVVFKGQSNEWVLISDDIG